MLKELRNNGEKGQNRRIFKNNKIINIRYKIAGKGSNLMFLACLSRCSQQKDALLLFDAFQS